MTSSPRARWIAGVLLATVAASAQARTVLLFPLDRTLTAHQAGLVVGFCDTPEAESVELSVNGQTEQVPVWDGVFTADLTWSEGINVVAVGGQTVSVRYDPYADVSPEPAVHAAVVDNCESCHVLEPGQDLRLKAEPGQLCARCHSAREHGIRHRGTSCSDCHVPHASGTPHLLRTADNALCVSCHAEQSAGGAKTAHGAIASGPGCTECHEAHSPRPGPEDHTVCEACHGEHRSGVDTHMDTACTSCHWMHRDAAEARYKEPLASCATCHRLSPDAEHTSVVVECASCHIFHEPPAESPVTGALCVRCHARLSTDRHGSGGSATADCAACHSVHNPRDLSRTAESCAACHPAARLAERHPRPVEEESDCLACHRVHGNDTSGLLVRVQHAPYQERRCALCHEESLSTPRGASPEGTSCATCHGELARSSTHSPARSGQCGACHDPHGGDAAGLLRRSPAELCRSCHGKAVGTARPDHPAMVTCLSCHDPHRGSGPDHLRAAESVLCAGCHAAGVATIQVAGGRPVHDPADGKRCSACHAPHGHEALAGVTAPEGSR